MILGFPLAAKLIPSRRPNRIPDPDRRGQCRVGVSKVECPLVTSYQTLASEPLLPPKYSRAHIFWVEGSQVGKKVITKLTLASHILMYMRQISRPNFLTDL